MSTSIDHRFSKEPWRSTLLVLFMAVAAVLLLYRDTAWAMVQIWERSETFAHAFVVPPIALWLIWRRRHVLVLQRPSPTPWLLLPLAGLALLWLLGDLVAVNSVTQLAMTAMLVLIVPTVLGWRTARLIAFPLGFLFFAVPIGEFLMPQLMEWTADFTIFALRLSGIPVYREGLHFIIPSGSWSVVEACSGIRYLMASMMVGTLFAYLNYSTTRRRWIFVGVSILLPLLANWLRAYMIVMLGHLSGNKLATGADHLIYGWVFFGIIMLLMFMIGSRWAEPDTALEKAVARAAADEVSAPALAAAPASPARRWGLAPALLLVLLMPTLMLHSLARTEGSATLSLSAPELKAQGWQRQPQANAPWTPSFENPSGRLHASYQGGQGQAQKQVGLHIEYYRQQDYQRKLISSNNVLVISEDKRWAQVSRGTAELGALPVRTAELRAATLNSTSATERLQVVQFFWINGRLTRSDMQAKLYGALERLLGRGDDAAAVIVYTDKTEGAEAEALLAEFLRDNWTDLDAWLRHTAQQARQIKTETRN